MSGGGAACCRRQKSSLTAWATGDVRHTSSAPAGRHLAVNSAQNAELDPVTLESTSECVEMMMWPSKAFANSYIVGYNNI